jgi:hypothetical protein
MTANLERGASERIVEIGDILAAGLMRVMALKSSPKSPDSRESSLDISRHQSGHRDPETGEQ